MKRKIFNILLIVSMLIVILLGFTGCGEKNKGNANDSTKQSSSESKTTQNYNKIDMSEVTGVGNFSCGLALVYKDKKYGYIDKEGNIVVDFLYTKGDSFTDDGFASVTKDGKQITLYKINDEINEYDFKVERSSITLKEFNDGLALVCKDGKYGFINKKGEIVLDFQYSRARAFSNERAWVKDENDNEFFIDTTGKKVIELKDLYCIQDFYDGIVAVSRTSKAGSGEYYINTNGERISEIYDTCYFSRDGMAMIQQNKKYGFIESSSGKLVVEPIYDFGTSYYESGLAPVQKDGKCGFIDKQGNVVIDFKYKYANSFNYNTWSGEEKGRATAYVTKDNDSNCYIDIDENEYGSALFFTEGLAYTTKNGKYGYIEKDGNTVIDYQYTSAGNFKNGLAPVKLNGKWGYIDKIGKMVIETDYDKINEFSDGLAKVEKNKKIAFINTKGEVVLGNID